MTFTFPRFTARARCADEDPDAFFPDKGGTSAPAKRICNGDDEQPPCPARDECLAWALANERHGVWGGMSERERKRIAGYRAECGTPTGYKWHVKRREAMCNLCRRANADYSSGHRGVA